MIEFYLILMISVFFPTQDTLSQASFRSRSSMRPVCKFFSKTSLFLRGEDKLYLLTASHFLESYSLIGNQFDPKKVIMGSPELMDLVMRLKNLWQLRQTATLDGTTYKTITNASITLCKLSIGQAQRGVLALMREEDLSQFLQVATNLFGNYIIINLPQKDDFNPLSGKGQDEAFLILKLLITQSLL